MHIASHDLANTTFHIEVAMRADNGAIESYSEAHRLGIPAEGGKGTIVGYSEEWAHDRAETVAAEMGCEVLEVETFYWTDRAHMGDDQ